MEHSEYVLLSGCGAEEFALTRGFEFVPRSYFYTAERWRQLERIRGGDAQRLAADHLPRRAPSARSRWTGTGGWRPPHRPAA